MHKYVEIIPILKLPKSLGIFDYAVPAKLESELKVGQIVRVPFRKKEVLGVVFKLKEKTAAEQQELKTVNEIVEKEPLVTEVQLKLLPWLANYYFQSPALMLKAMLPKILKRPKRKVSVEQPPTLTIKLSPPEKLALAKIAQTKNHTLIVGKPSVDFYLQLIDQQFNCGRQSLLLLPEIELAKSFVKHFQNYFGASQLAVLHSEISNSEYYLQWKKIISGEIKIIIGTRSAVFAPVVNLGLIIIDSEHDQSFKQWDQNPRYSAPTVAKKLAALTGAKILMSSLTPKVTTYLLAKKEKWPIIDLITNYQLPITTVIDMRDEYKKKNFSIFSERLQAELKKITKDGQAILFINRKGTSSFVICRDCGYVPKCENCGLPYSYYAAAKFGDADLYCYHCKKHGQLAPFCPKCSGSRFKPAGFGSQKVVSELKQLCPELRVARVDSDLSDKQIKKTIDDFKNKKTNVLVATQLIFGKQAALPPLSLAALVSADTSLQIPDFSAQEKTWQLIKQAANLSDKTVLVQTWNPENFAVHFAAGSEWQKFYEQELKNRQEFGYPPWGELIKLIFQDVNYQTAKGAASALSKKLKKYLKEQKLPVKVLGPVLAATVKVRGRFRFNLILKFKKRGEWLKNLMALVPDNWLIDVEPEELI